MFRIKLNILMQAREFIRQQDRPLKSWQVKVKLRHAGYTNIVDTTVQARTAEMARRILRAQYNNSHVQIGQPRELRSR
jgi:hypothetical protein